MVANDWSMTLREVPNKMECFIHFHLFLPESGMYCPGCQNGLGCFDRVGISLWDALSGEANNGMVCFVPRSLPYILVRPI